jgi:CRISPR/Cas system CMR subunit Cmr4 (Cas7 group RAMP superfamily)
MAKCPGDGILQLYLLYPAGSRSVHGVYGMSRVVFFTGFQDWTGLQDRRRGAPRTCIRRASEILVTVRIHLGAWHAPSCFILFHPVDKLRALIAWVTGYYWMTWVSVDSVSTGNQILRSSAAPREIRSIICALRVPRVRSSVLPPGRNRRPPQ